MQEKIRIAKAMANAGFCSRREAEKFIEKKQVKVNGEIVTHPAFKVAEEDHITCQHKTIKHANQKTRLWLYNKPKGLICSHSDPQGRPTIFEKIHVGIDHVKSIGRLDFNSEGLILITNNGHLAQNLSHPSTGWKRKYRVRVHGKIQKDKFDLVQQGINFEGIQYRPAEIVVEKQSNTISWLNITVVEGKKHEVKKICEFLSLKVTRLIRISFGPFQLGKMEQGSMKEISSEIIEKQLKKYISS